MCVQEATTDGGQDAEVLEILEYYQSTYEERLAAREIAAAGVGCAVADSIFNSLEVLKVRAQLGSGAESTLALARSIIRREGIRALALPGLGATQLRAMTYTACRIGGYPEAKRRVAVASGLGPETLGVRVGAGMLSGAIGSALFTPVDLVRVRLQSQPQQFAHTPPLWRTFSAFVLVARQGGISALYRGASACVVRGTVLSASQLSTYDASKQVTKRAGLLREGPALHVCCSLLSGLVAQTVIQPVDTLKTLMMRPPSRGAPGTPGGLLACAGALVREGGLSALYRGYLPALLRQGPVMLVQMPLIEQLRRRVFGVGYM